ncbi:MAG: ATP-binding protein [Saprospiraceae bacterium]|nr:HAMP domain-containing protein [Lewinella sp.]
MNLSFKNRIAFHYLIATALMTAVVFFMIFQVVQSSVYLHLDDDLVYEAHKHTKEIKLEGKRVIFRNKAEWEEREHREAEVNPVFIQLVGLDGEVMDKSPNLKEDFLAYQEQNPSQPFDALLRNRSIRQVQIPVSFKNEQTAYLLTAMSLENSKSVLTRLRNILFLSFPVVLLLLFMITRMIADRSILPIRGITQTADNITRNNLNERIALPRNKDELFSLTTSINHLLDRVEEALEREKQFTADASHELRTPLTVLKGTLEVLIRKPREQEEYKAKIGSVVQEIDRMSEAVEQLLTLARMDNVKRLEKMQDLNLLLVLDDIVQRNAPLLQKKNIQISINTGETLTIFSDPHLIDLLLDNIFSNAIKYSEDGSRIQLSVKEQARCVLCVIEDEGIGIRSEDINKVFTPFFRSDALEHKHIKGNGLGLAIVKKIAFLLRAEIDIDSRAGQGTRVSIRFPRTLS